MRTLLLTSYRFLFLIACMCSTSTAKAQFVTIPDPAFVSWLNNSGYAGCMSGNQLNSSCTAVVNTTILNCSFSNISDLTGIHAFVNLTELDCYNNNLSTLPTFLPANLQYIGCNNNHINFLSSLPSGLMGFACAGNQLNFMPTLPSNLMQLFCSYNALTSLPALPANLQVIECYNNQLTSLPVLPNNLYDLKCNNNNLVHLPTLPSNLSNLTCNHANLVSLPALPASLKTINCAENYLTGIPTLPAQLTSLVCNNNLLTTLPALPSSLTSLAYNNNTVSTMPSLPAGLSTLICASNQIANIASVPAHIQYFDCGDNQLTSLPALPDTLDNLIIRNNPGIKCFPSVKRINYSFTWDNTGITCFPNALSAASANPTIQFTPICNTPSQPGAINGSAVACAGTGLSYSITAVNNANAYAWTLPPGWTGSSNTNTIQVTTGTTGGAISVAGVNTCINSSGVASTINIVVNPIPAAPAYIAGNARPCPGDTGVVYTIPATANAVSYYWYIPPGATITSGNGTTSIKVNYPTNLTTTTLSAQAITSCLGNIKTKTISKNIPGTPAAISGPAVGVCSSTTHSYSIPAVNYATTYQWTVPAGITINSGQGTTSVSLTFPAGFTTSTISVMAGSTCGFGNARTLLIKSTPAIPASITGPASVCANQQAVVYTAASVNGATSYTWIVPTGATITSGQGTSSMVMNFGTAAGNVKVKAVNACGAGTNKTLAVAIVCRASNFSTDEKNGISVYPNPSGGHFSISISAGQTEKYNLTVRDLLGRIAEEHLDLTTSSPFEFGESLVDGVYLLHITDGKQDYNIQVVKIH